MSIIRKSTGCSGQPSKVRSPSQPTFPPPRVKRSTQPSVVAKYSTRWIEVADEPCRTKGLRVLKYPIVFYSVQKPARLR